MAEMDFDDFAKKTLRRADLLIRAVGIKTFSAVIRDTPVGDPDLWQSSWLDTKGRATVSNNSHLEGYVGGRLRGNWRCSLAMPDETVSGEFDFPSASAALSAVNDTCNAADRKKTLWLSNSLPYAYRIEYEGHSRQAPEGMVRRNVTRIKGIISSELRKLK
jgi:hypothetical protein